MEDNVIRFPKDKLNSPPQTMEETLTKIVKNRIIYSNDFCSGIMNIISSIMESDDIDIEDEYYMYELELLKGALQSIHLKSNGIQHILQDVAFDLYSEEVDVEEILSQEE